ncbi:E3 ubiquitin-protein ligase RNF4 [Setaria italica]|nr:E3 ubiquitin-protein ligase RNF4 [Setaria italica]XP_034596814.1 E3 ubiquitin-protein ligase RNF4-like [Setaria viridis]
MRLLQTRCTDPRQPRLVSYLNRQKVGGQRKKPTSLLASSQPRTLVAPRGPDDEPDSFLCSIGFGQACIFYCNTMNSPGAGRRIQKRRRTTTKSLSQLLDLNCPPAEGAEGGSPFSSLPVSHNEASSSMTVQLNQASSSIPPATNEPHIGMHSCPIDVEAIDDDVVIYSSTSLPQARQQSTRRITVILDDDSDTNPEPAGDALDEHVNTLLSLGTNRRHEPPSATNTFPVISLVDTPEVNFFKAPPEPVKEVPKEPKFTCPICMNELTEAASTVCGHIFCQKCIKAAIQAQKKCPTCRRTLNKNQHHRVYLPTTE